MSKIEQNTASLRAILDAVNALPEADSGTDTSDATATAEDVIQGKTAYAADGKITGSMPILSGTLNVDVYPAWNSISGLIQMPFSLGSRCALENGSTIWPSVEGAYFGNASAADVAKGKTFTSANGLKVAGTYEASGGLPDGISVLASGSVTAASDSTYETVTHNLGVIPNFIMWAIEDDVSAAVLTSAAVCGSSFLKTMGTATVQYLVRGFGSTGSAAGTTGSTSSTVYMTTTQARIVAHNSYKLKAGYTYHWVCGVMNGVEE